MKKSILLTLSLIALLSACNSQESIDDISENSFDSVSLNISEEDSVVISETESEELSIEESIADSVEESITTTTVTLDFDSFAYSAGSHVEDNLNGFKNDMKEQVNIANDVDAANVTYNKFDKNNSDITYLTIGSSGSGGYLKLTFSQKIISVKVYSQNYYSFYTDTWSNPGTSTTVYNIDDGEYSIGNKTVSHENVSTNSAPETYADEFDINSTFFKIENDYGNQRVFIHKIELTY